MPSRLWYVVAILVLLAGIAGGVSFMMPRLTGLSDDFIRVIVPGDHEIELPEAGSYTIFHEPSGTVEGVLYTASDISGLRVSLSSAAGGDIALGAGSGSRYTAGGHRGYSIFTFEIPSAGAYHLAAAYDDGRTEPRTILAVSGGFVSGLVFTILGTIAMIFAGIGLALAVGLTTFFRRRRFRQAAGRSQSS